MTNPTEPSPDAPAAARPAPARRRWRLFLAMPAVAAPPEHGSAGSPWPAILEASRLPLAGEGVGRGRFVVAAPLPLGISGEREIVDILLTERLPVTVVRDAVRTALPPGWSLVDLHDVWVGAPSAPSAVVAADYRVLVTGAPRWALEGAALALLAAATLPRERRREKKVTSYDLRSLLLGLSVRASGGAGVTLAMRLRQATDAVGRPEEVMAALGEPPAPPLAGPLEVRAITRARLVLADDPDAPPG